MDAKPELLVQVRNKLRARHYSCRTERQYLAWIRRFILDYDKRHPREMSAREIESFLIHLSVDRSASASTQNQALSFFLFLYKGPSLPEGPTTQHAIRADAAAAALRPR